MHIILLVDVRTEKSSNKREIIVKFRYVESYRPSLWVTVPHGASYTCTSFCTWEERSAEQIKEHCQ